MIFLENSDATTSQTNQQQTTLSVTTPLDTTTLETLFETTKLETTTLKQAKYTTTTLELTTIKPTYNLYFPISSHHGSFLLIAIKTHCLQVFKFMISGSQILFGFKNHGKKWAGIYFEIHRAPSEIPANMPGQFNLSGQSFCTRQLQL